MASDSKATIGLALAGGGPLGAVYELGALSALAEALEGVDFNALDVYVGVSAGGFIAAGLANGVPPRKLAAMFVESETSDEPLSPSMLLKPAFREYARRAASVPPLLLNSIWHYISNPLSANFFESFQRLSRAIPTGVFNNAGIDDYLTRLFSAPGRTNDFRDLRHKLFLVATDLDTGESVSFGAPGFDHVPISSAVQASAALPGLFPPVEIENRYYVDGALKKTLHASVALDYGAKLLLCVNPLVPFDSQLAARRGLPRDRKLIEGGLPVVLAQTFRAIIHSRMQVGMSKYDSQYRGADVVLFEPNRDDADMFFTNMFSYSSRRRLSEHAYQKTRAELLRRYDELRPVLERHGVSIRLDVLRDPTRRLLGVSRRSRRPASQAMDATRELASTLADLETALDKRLRRIKRAA
ncbi:MAG: patatin-like phospholipase family protein [Sterolibacteriaceae bacterium]|uniref:Patatin-like phospholipase family protein n=1 Tax=Candidatus Methylophosphatis roskildensis TaxID=2899263 RepID=A0A9D7DYL9_9PROT|nr:patatin-like phospholipase family protein [Candidatus Methylophosphatis roskildensis]